VTIGDAGKTIIAFGTGVASSITAEIVVFYFRGRSIAAATARWMVRRGSWKRLEKLRRSVVANSNDPHTLVRAEWACALYDVGSHDVQAVQRGLKSLFAMADLLEEDEREAARNALRLRFAANPVRSIDSEYLKTMEKLL